MALADLKFVGFLKDRMHWHQARQKVLAENVANSDTPRYRPKDLKAMKFGDNLKENAIEPVSATVTHQSHFAASTAFGQGRIPGKSGQDFEVTRDGNAVVLEEQMIKVTENQFDYQLASTLYSRSLGLLKTAIGKGSV